MPHKPASAGPLADLEQACDDEPGGEGRECEESMKL